MLRLISFLFAAALLVGCGDGITTVSETEKPGGYTVFDDATGDIPYPNNLLFSGSIDGTLNIPYDPQAPEADVKAALNTLDGFSTVSPISVTITAEMDPGTLAGNVHLFKVKTITEPSSGVPAVVATEKALTYGEEFVATIRGLKLVILPLIPLEGDSSYMVVLTDGIANAAGQRLYADATTRMLNGTQRLADTNGNPTVYFHPDATVNAQTAAQLEGLRQLTQLMIAQAEAGGIARERIVMTWSFDTQSIGKVARALADHNASGTLTLQPIGLTSSQLIGLAGEDNSSFSGNADVYAGTLAQLPYYLGVPTEDAPTAPLDETFDFVPDSGDLPQVRDNRTIPVLSTVPRTMEAPESGWPVVIFQHGIFENRTNLLAIAEAFASEGFAAVAIDLPLHGITDISNPLYMASLERTFALDLIDNGSLLPIPDGKTDPSGTHYLNIYDLLVARDNLRQSTSDLLTLQNALSSAVGISFDAARVAFVGHSMGTLAAFGYLANASLETVTLGMPGGGIAELLNHSQRYGPVIEAALAANGILKGTPEYDAFIVAAQTIVDDADPVNYALGAGKKQTMFIVGVKEDDLIPNSVPTAPLAGTRPLITLTSSTDINLSAAPGLLPVTGNAAVCFAIGDHVSFLDPRPNLDVTVEMQTQTASFLYTKGAAVQITDASLLFQ